MKTYAFGLSVLFASTSFACPNLAGHYHCSPSNKDISISQSESSGVTTYVIDGTDYAATGILDSKIQAQSDGSTMYFTFKYSCDADALKISENYDHESKNDQPLEVSGIDASYAKSASGELKIDLTHIYGDGSFPEPEQVCK